MRMCIARIRKKERYSRVSCQLLLAHPNKCSISQTTTSTMTLTNQTSQDHTKDLSNKVKTISTFQGYDCLPSRPSQDQSQGQRSDTRPRRMLQIITIEIVATTIRIVSFSNIQQAQTSTTHHHLHQFTCREKTTHSHNNIADARKAATAACGSFTWPPKPNNTFMNQ